MSSSACKGLTLLLRSSLLTLSVLAATSNAAEEPTQATPTPEPGAYCPGQGSVYLILEELTVALQMTAKAKESLLVLNDNVAAEILLARAGNALALAAGRGSGARVATLINAAMAAKEDGNPTSMLLWFPLLKSALSGLPADPTRAAAASLIASAEAMTQGQAEGDEIETLLRARQLLVCDPLDIPLQQSLVRLSRMQRSITQGARPSADDFSALIDLLNRAMDYGQRRLVKLERS